MKHASSPLTPRHLEILSQLSKTGEPLIPVDQEVFDRCAELAKRKLLTAIPVKNRADKTISMTYSPTAIGLKWIAASRKSICG